MPTNFDFSGYATKNDLLCADGRKIKKDAFKNQDGAKVPLVWQHLHDSTENVLGHAILENRADGVYVYGFFNETEDGKRAKALVQHKDIVALSIYANGLVEKGKEVFHGIVREVSLVMSGANPGAFIDNLALAHADGTQDDSLPLDEAIIYTGDQLVTDSLEHSEKTEAKSEEKSDDEAKEETIGDIFNTLTEKQKDVVYAMIGEAVALENGEEDESGEMEQSAIQKTTEGEQQIMKKNVFDGSTEEARPHLTSAQFAELMEDAKKTGSLKTSFLAHAGTYGIDNISYLFPDAQALTKEPTLIKRQMEWVSSVIDAAHHSPFSRIKSVQADITVETARAKGYVTGALKTEEVFGLLRRITTPTTIYKKQKLDRDDILDITEMDVVVWLKAEMYLMIKEELARAILITDGRAVDHDDKIPVANIRPIWLDDDMYADKTLLASTDDTEDLIDAIIRARENYRGSGNPSMFVAPGTLTDMLLLKATGDGRRMYATEAELTAALRVKKIVEVPLMADLTRSVTVPAPATIELKAIIVNMSDYTIGADKGGQLTFFDDFDIDYNQYKYLLETRVCGALTMPKSALVIEQTQA